MLSNDVLHSVRYISKANNNDLVRTLALDNVETTTEWIVVWLRRGDEEGLQCCSGIVSSSFLSGLIYEKRGKDGSVLALEPEHRINNNIVLKRLHITFSLKVDGILVTLTEQQFRVPMPEITAIMRAPDYENFHECDDQFLRYLLRGLAVRQHVKKSQDGYSGHMKRGRRQIISLL